MPTHRTPDSSRLGEQARKLLRKIREESGLKQADVAALLGEPQSFVSKYEMGERRLDLELLERICSALGIDLLDFIRQLKDDQ